MNLDRSFGQIQFPADALVGQPQQHQPQDPPLPLVRPEMTAVAVFAGGACGRPDERAMARGPGGGRPRRQTEPMV